MSLGNRLKEARLRRGYTQQEVADMVGVKKNTITGYEKDDRQPDVVMLKKLIRALGVPSAELLDLPDFDDTKEDASCVYSERAVELARLYDQLSPEGREIIDTNAALAAKYFLRAPGAISEDRPLQVFTRTPEGMVPEIVAVHDNDLYARYNARREREELQILRETPEESE